MLGEVKFHEKPREIDEKPLFYSSYANPISILLGKETGNENIIPPPDVLGALLTYRHIFLSLELAEKEEKGETDYEKIMLNPFYLTNRGEDGYLDGFSKFKNEILSALENTKKGDIILDIGCGWGNALEEMFANHELASKGVRGLGITLYLPYERIAELREKGIDIKIGAFHLLNLDMYRESVALAFDAFGALYYYQKEHRDAEFISSLRMIKGLLKEYRKLLLVMERRDFVEKVAKDLGFSMEIDEVYNVAMLSKAK